MALNGAANRPQDGSTAVSATEWGDARAIKARKRWGMERLLTVEVETDGRVALPELVLRSHLVFASVLNGDILNFERREVRVAVFLNS